MEAGEVEVFAATNYHDSKIISIITHNYQPQFFPSFITHY